MSEAKSQLYLALKRQYIDQDGFNSAYELCDKTARQISKLIEYLKNKK